jgi:carbamoyl-phosphate synthase large subunit
VKIIGTSPESIDLAEDRKHFNKLLEELQIPQAPGVMATSIEEAVEGAKRIGYPVLVRPSYVLGGRAMVIAYDEQSIVRYMKEAVIVSGKSPVLIDRYLSDAIEVDVDALADGKDVFIAGIMEHIEEAGIHSGDSACSLPPHSLKPATIKDLEEQTRALALALKVGGLMNVQYAIKDGDIYVLEVNPRASRTVPFVAKTIGVPVAKIAARIIAGEPLASFGLKKRELKHIAVKEAVFPFARFPGVDTVLGPEMRSTGEVMGISKTFGQAFAKAQLAAGQRLPRKGTLFISVNDRDKKQLGALGRDLAGLGFKLVATRGTAAALQAAGIEAEPVYKVNEGRPNIVDLIKTGKVDLIINTPLGRESFYDEKSIRRAAIRYNIPCITTLSAAHAAARGIRALHEHALEVSALQDLHGKKASAHP